MSSIKIYSAAALFAAAAHAGSVIVQNQCAFPVRLTPTEGAGPPEADQYLQPGNNFTRANTGSAWCLKMYTPDGEHPTQLEWTQSNNMGLETLFYDLSDIDMGDDKGFLNHGMSLVSTDPACQDSHCAPANCAPSADGQACKDAYNQPNDVRTLSCSPDHDLVMSLCTQNDKEQLGGILGSVANSIEAPSIAPAAPQPTTLVPQSSPAPAAAPLNVGQSGAVQQAASDANVVYETVVNTAVDYVTAYAKRAEATAAPEPVHHNHRRHLNHHQQHARQFK